MLPPPIWTGGPRPVALYDTECFWNFWYLAFQTLGGYTWTFVLRNGESFTPQQCTLIRSLFENFRTVGFNSDYYDVPMLRGALMGLPTDQLKVLNDRMIVEKVMPWELGVGDWVPADHVDLKPVCPGAGSQNQFAARIHHHTIEDFEIDFSKHLTPEEMDTAAQKCVNDLGKLRALYDALQPQLRQRERLGQKYGVNVMSKSDAQVAEAILKKQCERATGQKIWKQKIWEIDWQYKFQCDVPDFIQFQTPQLQRALQLVKSAVFGIQPPPAYREDADADAKGRCIVMPPQIEGLTIAGVGAGVYKMGIGGLHSQEKRLVAFSSATHELRMPDVRAYYPNLMVNAGAWPEALGPDFVSEFKHIKEGRELAKALAKKLATMGFKGTVEWEDADSEDGGGKIMINGTFGKTGSPFSVLWAPKMLIQTTLPGQLSLLMLIEWHELYGIPVISANTDGLVILCPRDKIATSDWLIAEWEKRTGLTMETEKYKALYARDVNNYFAIPFKGDVKRKGELCARAGLVEKKNPDTEICGDAVEAFLVDGTPIEKSIRECRDIRKFITIQKVAGGAVKFWGEGLRKDQKVAELLPTLQQWGWVKGSRAKWVHPTRPGLEFSARDAYAMCFAPRVPEWMGVTARWYYSTKAPGPILYRSNGNTVGASYGARPAQVLPETFPDDVDYEWYERKARGILEDIGANVLAA